MQAKEILRERSQQRKDLLFKAVNKYNVLHIWEKKYIIQEMFSGPVFADAEKKEPFPNERCPGIQNGQAGNRGYVHVHRHGNDMRVYSIRCFRYVQAQAWKPAADAAPGPRRRAGGKVASCSIKK